MKQSSTTEKRKAFSIRLSPRVFSKLKQFSKKEEKSQNLLIEEAVMEYLDMPMPKEART